MNESLTQNVTQAFGQCADARTKEIVTALVRHLHAFAREVNLTGDEWRRGIEFLTATGKKCSGIRQEFILLSDTLGPFDRGRRINHITTKTRPKAACSARSIAMA